MNNLDNQEKQKIRIALIYGGRSGEHPISCATAGAVMRALDPEKYEVLSIAIAQDGTWVPGEIDPGKLQLNGASTIVKKGDTRILFGGGDGSQELLLVRSAAGTDDKLEITSLGRIDVAFPLLHGPFGEDGTIQGLLEMANVPYVGCGVFASAAGMDKDFMKIVLQSKGIAVGSYVAVPKKRWINSREQVLEEVQKLTFPVYVKPARAGSSLGITRVESLAEVAAAVEDAQLHDPKVIIESGIDGREIECAVLGGRGNNPARAAIPGEVTFAKQSEEFYDFEHKYLDTESLVMNVPPKNLSAAECERVRELAVRAFQAFECEGLTRIDMFLKADGTLLVNEINTMPGFTPFSMYPVMWEKAGMPYAELIEELISLAIARGTGLH
ncbi:D-alanine--D-alanine ligase family protein [Arcanobacterium hippocoleae]|uniref:D-alanine--D-alanine ligase n=1 Tax=Arcanobacterium hippocoleae TaxID=149017 RepID=A0ABU1T406_9ACTO|nr:D-alanine--D-alanine ligase family protein [Arcanobacterium hippocoleae]MDR6940119.1 D-alanine-D-alanine ligase [Arcanobacterium hippocoleae]